MVDPVAINLQFRIMNISTAIFILCAATSAMAQVKVECKNGLGQYQQVIDVPGKSAKEIYTRAHRWVLGMYTSPEPGKIENEMLKGVGAGSVRIALGVTSDFKYAFTIEVKDGRARYTMSAMQVGNYTFETYVFKSDCTTRSNAQATNIINSTDELANRLISSLAQALNDSAPASDW